MLFYLKGHVVEDVVEDVGDDEGNNRVMLHPYVQKEIKHFNKARLNHVVPPKRPSPGRGEYPNSVICVFGSRIHARTQHTCECSSIIVTVYTHVLGCYQGMQILCSLR